MKTATKKDKICVVDILTKAFDDNKSFNSIIIQDDKRAERIKKVFEYYFEVNLKYGKILISDDEKACAVISFPEQKKTTIKSILRDINLLFLLGLKSVKKGFERESIISKTHPKHKFYYLLFIGVDPEFQNSGKGSQLLKDLIIDSKVLSRPIYLETYLDKNVTLYKKHGFSIFETLVFDFPVYCMKLKND